MTLRKAPSQSWESWTDRLIRESEARGEFDNLPGAGKPIPDSGGAYDPDWWLKSFLQREEVSLLPKGLELQADVEREIARIRRIPNPAIARHELQRLNERIRQAKTEPMIGPGGAVRELEFEELDYAPTDAAASPASDVAAHSSTDRVQSSTVRVGGFGWLFWAFLILGVVAWLVVLGL